MHTCREGSLWMKKITERMRMGAVFLQDTDHAKTSPQHRRTKLFVLLGKACSWPTQSFIASSGASSFDCRTREMGRSTPSLPIHHGAHQLELLHVQIVRRLASVPKGPRVIEACIKRGKICPSYCLPSATQFNQPAIAACGLIEMGIPRLGPDRKPENARRQTVINWIPASAISCGARYRGRHGDRPITMFKDASRGDGVFAHQSSA